VHEPFFAPESRHQWEKRRRREVFSFLQKKVTTDFGKDQDEAYALTIDNTSRIVVGGHIYMGQTNTFTLRRYNP